MELQWSAKAKWVPVWVYAFFSAGAIYFAVVTWPYPRMKDLFCAVGAVMFLALTIVSWSSARNNWSREKYDRVTTRVGITTGIITAVLLILNYIGHHAASG
jgi:hypothetical protein